MSWAELCKKFSIEYDDSLRLSRINEWMRTNGHPKNIRQPKEMINSSLKESIQNAAENVGIKLKFITDHDMFVTLIGTDKKISKELNKLGCEFLEL